MLTRRSWFGAAAALTVSPALRLQARKLADLKIGVTDWDLKLSSQVEALALGKSIGFDAVEVSLGRKPEGDQLPLAAPQLAARYLDAVKKENIRIAGACLDILHVNFLKSDPLARKWVLQGIAATRALGARNLLLPFFGRGALKTTPEMDYVADILKELAPEADKAGVRLALENTLSAEDNARILDRVDSHAVCVYYDVGNSTYMGGFDVVKEIRWLKQRIGQVHLKDKGYLGEGKIDFPAVIAALADIGFAGYAVLETSSPSGSVENDMKKNLAYVRRLVEEARRS